MFSRQFKNIIIFLLFFQCSVFLVHHLGYFGTIDSINLNISKLKAVNLYLSSTVFILPNFREFS